MQEYMYCTGKMSMQINIIPSSAFGCSEIDSLTSEEEVCRKDFPKATGKKMVGARKGRVREVFVVCV